MKTIRLCWIALVLCLVGGSWAYAWQIRASSPAQKRQLTQDNNTFAFNMYKRLRKTAKGNIFWSPYSVSTALAMTYAGANAGTAKEMAKAMQFRLKGYALHSSFAHQFVHFNRPTKVKGYQLAIANRLWGTKKRPLLPAYTKLMMGYYGAKVGMLNFDKSEASRKTINKWVAKRTEDKIKDLLPRGSIDSLTRLVLTNAIYFKGDWYHSFKKKDTRKRVFWESGTKKTKVPTMYRKGRIRYGSNRDAQILRLPYKKNGLAMWVILPKKKKGLAAIESKLSVKRFRTWRKRSYLQKVRVFLPRFKMRYRVKLKKHLKEMGMHQAFSERAADFSKMTGKRHLKISQVYHQAFVKVNEKGTEAAAATAVVAASRGRASAPPVFRANRPFLFLIRDDKTGAILFMGRVKKP